MKEIGRGGTMEQIRLHLGSKPDLVIWRNQAGFHEEGERKMKYGLTRGASDLIGVMRPSGRFIAFECKAPGKKPTADQLAFISLVERMGGCAGYGSSVDEAEDFYLLAGGRFPRV